MNGKKFLMALVGGFLVMWLLSGLWHVLIMGDFYAKYAGPSTFEEPKMLFIALGYAILALLMVYIYARIQRWFTSKGRFAFWCYNGFVVGSSNQCCYVWCRRNIEHNSCSRRDLALS